MRSLISALVLLAGTSLGAQSDTFIFHEPRLQASLLEMDNQGGILGTLAVLPSGLEPTQLLNSADNRKFQVLSRTLGLLEIDRNGVVTTLASGPNLTELRGVVRDQDGNSFVFHQKSRPTGSIVEMFKLVGSRLQLVRTLPIHTLQGARIDPETGQIVAFTVPFNKDRGYFRIDSGTGVVTTVVAFTGPSAKSFAPVARHLGYDAARGAFVDLRFEVVPTLDTYLAWMHPKLGISKGPSLGAFTEGFDLVEAGGRAHPVRYYVYAYEHLKKRDVLMHLAADGRVLRICPTQAARLTGHGTPLLRQRSNHLEWFRTEAPNNRVLRLSFPGEEGRNFVVGLSLTGIRPGVPLPDGRTIPLAIDPLTVISLAGGVPGLLVNTVGALSAKGESIVQINANHLGVHARGIQIWAAAMLLDPSAPSGIAHIAGPEVLVLR